VRLEPDGTLTVAPGTHPTSRGQVDELFESAALAHGDGVLAVVLTGMGDDGTRGARAVKAAGGTVVVQDWLTSTGPQMPASVIDAGAADLVLALGEIAELLDEVVTGGRRLPLP
jgi:two-component system chemotaxis response regulator CheB